MRNLRYSERQTAFILTKAAAVCPHGGTTCCPIVPEAPGLATGLPTASQPDDYVGGNGFQQDSAISTTLPFGCFNGCFRRYCALPR